MMKIKASLTNNVGIKVIAVVIAALIWLMIVNISDPEKTVIIYNIPINVTHEEVITDMNMVYDSDKNATVNITVSGKRSVVSKLFREMTLRQQLPLRSYQRLMPYRFRYQQFKTI